MEGRKRDVEIKELRKFLKWELAPMVAADPRLGLAKRNGVLTECTFQAILWDHICGYVGVSWLASLENFIPGTNQKADIVLAKLTKSGKVDDRSGCMAIEVKPNGQFEGLMEDLRKLGGYICRWEARVNFGVLAYLSPRDTYDEKLGSRAKKINERKLAVVRVDPRRMHG